MDNYSNADNIININDNYNNWSKKKYCIFIIIIVMVTLIFSKILYSLLFDVVLK
jgi:hypothetical protein